MSASRELPKRI